MTSQGVAVGIDLVQVSRIAESLALFGARFAARLFTAQEVAYCTEPELAAATQAARFAARFAAKEATLKVLGAGAGDRGLSWRSLEVRRIPPGPPELALHGAAREFADELGLTGLALSMSHEGDYATAVVIATRSGIGCAQQAGQPPRAAPASSPPPSQGEQVEMSETIRAIVHQHGRLATSLDTLDDQSDLYRAGMTSQASVNVMLALEAAFEIEFPDHLLKRSVFASIAAMRAAVEGLVGGGADLRSAAP
ncbi:MAG TPA: acyl carrier protein [Pseudomonadota bacterium]|nr:acyl carrier protein [Pseudomonadota bacterium]